MLAALRFAAGTAFLSVAVFGLMAAGVARPPVTATVAGIACWGIVLRRPRLQRPSMPRWTIAPFVLFTLFYLANALVPETEADPNIYHFLPAVEALRHGGFEREISFYAQLPHALELLYVVAFPFGGTVSGRLVHFAFLLASLPLIAAIGRRLNASPDASWAAALMYFASPIVGFTATAGFNDAALVFATLAVVEALLGHAPAWIAGASAGLCYAIKMTGGLAIPAGALYYAMRRQWRRALLFTAAATVITLPWILRNLWMTGNPVAPFFNRFFPNPYFSASFEAELARNLRSYGVTFVERFPELLWGYRLQGIIGPAFVVLPLALLFVKHRSQRVLLGCAGLLLIPWVLNAGTRFLMPALPFLCLALLAPLPSRAVQVLLLAHLVSALPPVIAAYAPHTLRLTRFPVAAALRLESEDGYLRRVSWDYRVARMVQDRTPAQARILDLHGVHAAHTVRNFAGWWQSPDGRLATSILEFARDPGRHRLRAIRADLPRRLVRSIRVRPDGDPGMPWSIVELSVWQGSLRVATRRTWSVEAGSNLLATRMAFDGNPATRWVGEDAAPLALDLGTPVELSSIRLLTADPARLAIDIQAPGEAWQRVPAILSTDSESPDLRREAARALWRLGFTHVVAPVGHTGIGLLGHNLVRFHEEWGLAIAGHLDTVFVFRIVNPGIEAP